jgi:hypothetical protein
VKLSGGPKRIRALTRELEESAGARVCVCGALAFHGPNVALVRETLQRCIHGTNGNGASTALLDFAADPHPIRVGVQTHDGSHNDLLQLTKVFAAWHAFIFYKIENEMSNACSR